MPGHPLPQEITVPFCYQCAKSGIGDTAHHEVLWYRRTFCVPETMRGKRILLRFGAVDSCCQVYVNGRRVGEHEGGYAPFAVDVTSALTGGENGLCLRVLDTRDTAQPRGKQNWRQIPPASPTESAQTHRT